MKVLLVYVWLCFVCFASRQALAEEQANAPRAISGIYPHLAMFNNENECGVGAVVPWADRLWMITYAPHKPQGSSDKLYEITPALEQIVRPESVGGTPANRMIHAESQQLFIGPYVIDAKRNVRVIPPEKMFGRLTANARHLQQPEKKIYYATMEEGIYEVDVQTLEVTELWRDEQQTGFRHADLPGYHGKGLYSGQGRLVYSNNGEHGREAQTSPHIPSGVLAEWDGAAEKWQVARRNQFTEVTGPGGIFGNKNPASDPIWSIGWDHRSLMLLLREDDAWHVYRLPKSSHSYDGAHGWNTEWPRIRDTGEEDLLMTMHGAFWRFPRTFSRKNSAGLEPRSNYLKVVGDFCRWQDQIVLGCDDAAHSEFLNKRNLKGNAVTAGQSQSNLWFIEPQQLDQFGPVLGRGGVWLDEPVVAGQPSDPFLFSGYDFRFAHFTHNAAEPVTFTVEVDKQGNGQWSTLREFEIGPGGHFWHEFDPKEKGVWIRVSASLDCSRATAFFQFNNQDRRDTTPDDRFAGLATLGSKSVQGGLLHARGANFRTLRYVVDSKEALGYDLDGELQLTRTSDEQGIAWTKANVAIPENVIEVDAASAIMTDNQGKRWRLPRGEKAFDQPGPLGFGRVCREVCTERDLLNVHGTFYELPAENAGGLSRVRPIASHRLRVHDFTSFRGLLVISGLEESPEIENPHILRSEDGKARLWAGGVDDLWKLGKPQGRGGPWKNSKAAADQPSDPYLMTGYDEKMVTLSHQSNQPVTFRLEIDFEGFGHWSPYREFTVPAGESVEYTFPAGFSAYWVRLAASRDCTATAWFEYE